MNADNNIVKQLINHLALAEERHKELFTKYEIQLNVNALPTIDTLMQSKKTLLMDLLNALPLGTNHCYFCLYSRKISGRVQCLTCKYGKLHGACNNSNSMYEKITTKLSLFHFAIKKNYYEKGEIQDIADSTVVKKLTASIKLTEVKYQKAFFNYLQKLLNAEKASVAELMKEKKKFLQAISKALPLNNNNCYFCSDYDKIYNTRNSFHESLVSYYKEEEY